VHSQVLIALLLGDKLNTGKIQFGLDGGMNFSSMTGMNTNKSQRHFNLGFYFDFLLKNNWYLNTGVLVKSNLGVDKLTDEDLAILEATMYDAEGDYSQKMNYFLVPALIKYKFKNHIYAELGPQFGLMYKSWIEFNSDVEGNDARIKEYNKNKLKKFDMGIDVGAGYRLLDGYGWTLGVRYYYGFLDVYKDIPGTKNSSWFLKLNIPVGVSEKTKEIVNEKKEKKKARKLERKQAKKQSKQN
jgi:hypothetical protein